MTTPANIHAGSSSPDHQPPQDRSWHATMALATRMIALPIFGRPEPQSPEEEVLYRFCPHVEALRERTVCDWSDFLDEQLALVRAHVDTLPQRAQAQLRPRIEALANTVDDIGRQTRRAAEAKRLNRGHQSCEHRELQAEAWCLSVLGGIHEHVVVTLENAIRDWTAPSDGEEFEPGHTWSADWNGQPPLQTPAAKWGARASTEFRDNFAITPQPVIRLDLAIERFDWPSFLVIAWLFAHEYVCHVRQSAPSSGEAPQPSRSHCPFFAGWMDELAYMLFEADLRHAWFRPAQSAFLDQHREESLQAAAAFRRDRYGKGAPEDRRYMPRQWELGATTARAIRRFFERVSPHTAEVARRRIALAQLVGLSYRIQAATNQPEILDEIVYACLRAASRGCDTADAAVAARVLHLFTRPIQNILHWTRHLNNCASRYAL